MIVRLHENSPQNPTNTFEIVVSDDRDLEDLLNTMNRRSDITDIHYSILEVSEGSRGVNTRYR